jgi:copper(I)-binding protein
MCRAIAVFGFIFLLVGAATTWANDYKVGDLTISRPWARASVGKAKTGAAYITIINDGVQVDRLISTSTPVAKKASLHTHLMDGDVIKMRRVNAVEVSPGEPAVMNPGGLHIMLMGLKSPLKEGAVFPLILTFERAGVIEVSVMVNKIGSKGHDAHGEKKHEL